MDLDALLLALAGGLGAGAGILAVLRLVLPWARKVIPAAVSISHAVEESQVRLIAAVAAERDEQTAQVKRCREELARVLADDE